ncbi:MAG: phosphoglycerate kinase [Firmicutes bacterium]|nr:phosphoglycerate kinase [Bacillota bacterium]
MAKRSVRALDVAHKRVLVRVDFNVPLDNGRVSDDTRIREALPTIQYLIDQGAKTILCSHLGRPKGQVVESMRLTPVARRLTELLGRPVQMAPDCVGHEVEAAVALMQPGDVYLLENLRFHPEEEQNDPDFARQLAALADIYVNDAFGAAHRAHASTEGVAHLLPAACGFLMEKELRYLGEVRDHPQHSFLAIIGGAKVSDKIGVLQRLLEQVDRLLIGGGMANTFLLAQGRAMGASLVETDKVPVAQDLLRQFPQKLVLPSDLVVTQRIEADATFQVVEGNVPEGFAAVDIGEKTQGRFAQEIGVAKTIFWNGPMGVFEKPPFDRGTLAVANAVASSGATSIVGGGDSVSAVQRSGVADKITHISTGGGASLEFMEGRALPGVEALPDV